jgi:muramoyltetrapeptide carboxypeptidase
VTVPTPRPSHAGPRTRPPALRPGDRVHVVAPSSPVPADALVRGTRLLESWGLDVVLGRHVSDATDDGMLAGSDHDRAADFVAAWTDPAAAAVVCARGGYGASRILGRVDWSALAVAGPRWLVGSSDVTALHHAVGSRLGLVTAFGPMPATELLGSAVPEAASVTSLHDLLFDRVTPDLEVGPEGCLRPGTAAGRLVGGNLTLVAALVGTPHLDGAHDAVVFLEDVSEQPYRVDRMLTQLLEAGWFRGVRGVALGTWEGCGDVLPVLSERLAPLGVPVLGGLPVGHGPVQLSLPLGAEVALDATRGTLREVVPGARSDLAGTQARPRVP